MSWTDGPLLGFDTETTGVDVTRDRIVTAAVVRRDAAGTVVRTWLIDPGIEIPAAATAIHGITTAQARAHGAAPAVALEEIAVALTTALAAGTPIVAFNASFDLSLLDAELRRHGLPTLAGRLGAPVSPVIDPLVLDRSEARYRRGKRTLADLCAVYQISDTANLHSADADVVATLDVLAAIAASFPHLRELTPDALHAHQVAAHRAWAEEFNSWRASRGMNGPGAELTWPGRDAAPAETVADTAALPA